MPTSPTAAIGRGLRTTVSVVDQLAIGGMLQWTMVGSGLGGIADLRLLDELGDGQRMETAFRPQVVLRRGGATLFNGELLGWSGVRNSDSAVTAIDFDLAPTLRAAGLASGVTDDTTVEITFRSTILSSYAAAAAPPLGRPLGQGDPLRNQARFSGTLTGQPVSSELTATSLALPTSVLSTSIYAVNGAVGAVGAAFGDVVTYRVRLGLPLTSARQVEIVAVGPGLAGAVVFDAGVNGGIPAAGHVRFGPLGSYGAATPTLTAITDVDGRAALQIDLGDVLPLYADGPSTIELLISAPVPPGVPVVFEARETEANAFGSTATAAGPRATLALIEPRLGLQLATVYASNDYASWTGTGGPFGYDPYFGQFGGIISSGGLDGEPFNDRLSGIDGDDDVTFIIAVDNRAAAAAHDVVIRATLPDGFAIPQDGEWLRVTNGAGTPLAVSGELFDPAGGLRLDPSTPLAAYSATNGLNVLLIGYTLRTSSRLDAGAAVRASTASVVQYATLPGGTNRAPSAPASATTETVATAPRTAISLLTSDLPGTIGPALALGEAATFQLSVVVPEGLSRGLTLGIPIPSGFEAVGATLISLGANITVQSQTMNGAGIVFGDTVNAPDSADTEADRIRIEVAIRPIQTPSGAAPHLVAIEGQASIAAGSSRATTASAPVTVTVGEPVAPSATLALVGSTLANGATATFRATILLPPGLSTGLRILDTLPAGLDYVAGSARVVEAGGVVSDGRLALTPPTALVEGRLLTLDFGRVAAPFSVSRQVVVELEARLTGGTIGATLASSMAVETGYARSSPSIVSGRVVNSAPSITGLPTSQAGRDDTILSPFTGLRVTDPDGGQQTLRITLGNTANGVLAPLGGGAYDPRTGIYTMTGTAAEVSAAAAALRFVPTRHQAGFGQTVLTDFAATVQDGAASSGAVLTRLSTTQTNSTPVIRNADPCFVATAGTPMRPFTGLLLQDADRGQVATLTIRIDPLAGVLTGAGPGRYNPGTGVFTSTGTAEALTVEAGQLLFTPDRRAATGEVSVAFALDDGAGGRARDTGTIAVTGTTLGTTVPEDLVTPLFIGPGPTNVVAVAPAGQARLTGTAGRDVFFVDGAAGQQAGTVTGFAGGDTIVLWGFRAGVSVLGWSDDDGLAGQTGRTLQADITGQGTSMTRMTFAGLGATDSDRFTITSGRVSGFDYLSVVA